MNIRTSFFILVALLILGCKDSPKPYATFEYEDFGPPAMAWETIGMQWWQWDDHGISSDPNYKYDIKVVVYRGISLNEIESLLPVSKAKKQDFRYIEYHDSIKYLNGNIDKVKQIDEQWAINLKERLVKTKKRIQQRIKPGN
jgi:hypothetical protein